MRWAALCRVSVALLLVTACSRDDVAPDDTGPVVPQLAAAGDAEAQTSLGWMFETGVGAPQSYATAARWYRAAAEQGNPLAQYALAELYARGLGVPRDDLAAATWYENAARGGSVSAQVRLGNLFEIGRGVPQSYRIAALWYARAAAAAPQGDSLPAGMERIAPASGDAAPALVAPLRDTPIPGYWLHIAAFSDPKSALAHWDRLSGRNADLLGGLAASLEPAGQVIEQENWVRLNAGPLADAAAAAALCARLRARNEGCAVTQP